MDFRDRVVLITGAARGIGFATASELGAAGARVVITDIDAERIKKADQSLRSLGVQTLACVSDVSDFQSCQSVVEQALRQWGRLDILINNAAISMVAKFEDCKPEPCRKLIEVNILGMVNMTMASLKPIETSAGHLVFVSSVSGIRAIPEGSLYSASKAAMRGFADSLRVELASKRVHVGTIFPGFTSSDPEKTVMLGNGEPRPIARPPHDTPEGVAKAIRQMIEQRRAELVLTPLGKFTSIAQRVAPRLLERLLMGRSLKN